MSVTGSAVSPVGISITKGGQIVNALNSFGLSAPTNNTTAISRDFLFVLNDGVSTIPSVKSLTLNINPEDFSIDDPYRVSAVQTQGGAFIDIWGDGIRRINIKGHTGWHTQTVGNQNQDGFDNLFNLKDQIISKYHSLREASIADNSSTDIDKKLKLTIIDSLHVDCYDVVPEYFRLMRSRSRPLLHMYEGSFIIVKDTNSSTPDPLGIIKNTSIPAISSTLYGLKSKIATIQKKITEVDPALGAVLNRLLDSGDNICTTFSGVLSGQITVGAGLASVSSSLTTVTQGIAQGIRNLEGGFLLNGIPAQTLLVFAETRNLFSSLACLLEHVQSVGLYSYSGIIDSSACAASYGLPTSGLSKSSNSFANINTLSNGSSSAASSAISSSTTTIVNKINSHDTALSLVS